MLIFFSSVVLKTQRSRFPAVLLGSRRVAWIVKLVTIGAGGEEEVTDILKIERPGDLDSAGLGLTSAEASLLLAGMQREIMCSDAQ
jgi:hypothetical protein